MSFKINGTVVIDNSRNVCACCITADAVEATSEMVIPSGTTACRPTGTTGSLYYDTDEGALVAYNGTDWAKQGAAAALPVNPYVIGEGKQLRVCDLNRGGCYYKQRNNVNQIITGNGGAYDVWWIARFNSTCMHYATPYGDFCLGLIEWDSYSPKLSCVCGYSETFCDYDVGYLTSTNAFLSPNTTSFVSSVYQSCGMAAGPCGGGKPLYMGSWCNIHDFLPGMIAPDSTNGGTYLLKKRCIGYSNVNTGFFVDSGLYTKGAWNNCGSSNPGDVSYGDNCCGVHIGSRFCWNASGACLRSCCGAVGFTVGFDPESVFDETCCFPASACCIFHRRFCGGNPYCSNAPLCWSQPTIDWANREVWFANFYGTCGYSQGFSVHCLCDGGNPNCIQCTYLVCQPLLFTGDTCCFSYENAYCSTTYKFPSVRDAVVWNGRYIFISAGPCGSVASSFSVNTVDRTTGTLCSYRLTYCCYQYPQSFHGLLVDADCNLRVYTSTHSASACGLIEHVFCYGHDWDWTLYPADFSNELRQINGTLDYCTPSPFCIKCTQAATLDPANSTPGRIYFDRSTGKIVMNNYSALTSTGYGLSFMFDPPPNDSPNCVCIFQAFESSNSYKIYRSCICSNTCIMPVTQCIARYNWCISVQCSDKICCKFNYPAGTCLVCSGSDTWIGICPGYVCRAIQAVVSDKKCCYLGINFGVPSGNIQKNWIEG